MLDEIELEVISQIPSKLAFHGMLPRNQTTIMPSVRDYQLLSPLLIFLASDEIKNNILLVIPSPRDLHHLNVGTSLLHVKLCTSALLLIVLMIKLIV